MVIWWSFGGYSVVIQLSFGCHSIVIDDYSVVIDVYWWLFDGHSVVVGDSEGHWWLFGGHWWSLVVIQLSFGCHSWLL